MFVTGITYNSSVATDVDYLTLSYDATTGSQLWVSTYDGPADAVDQAYALVTSPDGSRVIVTGESTGATTGWDWATVAYGARTRLFRTITPSDRSSSAWRRSWPRTRRPGGVGPDLRRLVRLRQRLRLRLKGKSRGRSG